MTRLSRLLSRCETATIHRPMGIVTDVVGMLVEVSGLRACVGQALEVTTDDGKRLTLEVIGFREDRLLASPLGALDGVHSGARVTLCSRGGSILVGEQLLGRVLDAFGAPLDSHGPLAATARYAVVRPPPAPFGRRPVEQALATGVRAIDGLLTLGKGQRLGIFAGAGVGKSSLLGMICRNSTADVNVVGLVGERGREVSDFARTSLGAEGLARSVLFAATSDQPPLVRTRGAEAATAAAEYFRDQGKNVLLVMDSVTRYAMALRETALAAGEPPATKGYPPSVFAALPRLLERTGTGAGEGVITALYTVFVEGDDLTDPIADAVRGILDGHIVLSRDLADQGHFPAIDVLASVSRLAGDVTTPAHQELARTVRRALGAIRDTRDLIQVGAYVPGSDATVDAALRLAPHLEAFLRQPLGEKTPFGQSLARLQSLLTAAKP